MAKTVFLDSQTNVKPSYNPKKTCRRFCNYAVIIVFLVIIFVVIYEAYKHHFSRQSALLKPKVLVRATGPRTLDGTVYTEGDLGLLLKYFFPEIDSATPGGVERCYDAMLNGERIPLFEANVTAGEVVAKYFVSYYQTDFFRND